MISEVTVPFGYKRITSGLARRGDGVWNGTEFKRVKKMSVVVVTPRGRHVRTSFWPVIGPDDVIIRRCEIKQVEMGLET